MRIDPHNELAAVGYGSGGLAIIDPGSRAKIADIRLSAHPEVFQIDPRSDHAFVNVDLAAHRVVSSRPRRSI